MGTPTITFTAVRPTRALPPVIAIAYVNRRWPTCIVDPLTPHIIPSHLATHKGPAGTRALFWVICTENTPFSTGFYRKPNFRSVYPRPNFYGAFCGQLSARRPFCDCDCADNRTRRRKTADELFMMMICAMCHMAYATCHIHAMQVTMIWCFGYVWAGKLL